MLRPRRRHRPRLPAAGASIRDAQGALVAELTPPAVADSALGASGPAGAPVGASSGCIEGIEPEVLRAFVADPGAFSARVDSAEHPDGALAAPFLRVGAVPETHAQASLSGAAPADGAPTGVGTVGLGIAQSEGVVCVDAFLADVALPATALRVTAAVPTAPAPRCWSCHRPTGSGACTRVRGARR